MAELSRSEMIALLHALVPAVDLHKVPAIALQALKELGVIEYDSAHDRHMLIVAEILRDACDPQHAAPFFVKYHKVLPLLAAHDLLATELIQAVLWFRKGAITGEGLETAVQHYENNVTLLDQGVEKV